VKEEEAVQNVISTIEAMSNPANLEDDQLVNIASGSVAPADLREDIAPAETIGEERCVTIHRTVAEREEVEYI
jgi:hypothetical protein